MTRVLVVEDDDAIGDAITSLLEEAGHQVTWVRDGQEALARLSGLPRPDVILLDLAMPVMDGFRFRQRQRGDEALASIPVVVCTADARGEATADALGAAALLRKPLDPERLLATVGSFGGSGLTG